MPEACPIKQGAGRFISIVSSRFLVQVFCFPRASASFPFYVFSQLLAFFGKNLGVRNG